MVQLAAWSTMASIIRTFDLLFLWFMYAPETYGFTPYCLCYHVERDGTWGVHVKEQFAIVDFHNKLRRENAPNASNMQRMIWDKDLAAAAQKLVDRCKFQHSKDDIEHVPGVNVGQNIAAIFGGPSAKNWTKVIRDIWFKEFYHFQYGVGSTNDKSVQHFAQIMAGDAVRVGCAYRNCDGMHLFVCNYAMSLTAQDIKTPWEEGSRCGSCPKRCENGLCDCRGKICINNGKLKLEDCTCTCDIEYYSGTTCEKLDCTMDNYYWCSTLSDQDCKIDFYLVRCPRRCGRC